MDLKTAKKKHALPCSVIDCRFCWLLNEVEQQKEQLDQLLSGETYWSEYCYVKTEVERLKAGHYCKCDVQVGYICEKCAWDEVDRCRVEVERLQEQSESRWHLNQSSINRIEVLESEIRQYREALELAIKNNRRHGFITLAEELEKVLRKEE